MFITEKEIWPLKGRTIKEAKIDKDLICLEIIFEDDTSMEIWTAPLKEPLKIEFTFDNR